jgi:hypothetical protein
MIPADLKKPMVLRPRLVSRRACDGKWDGTGPQIAQIDADDKAKSRGQGDRSRSADYADLRRLTNMGMNGCMLTAGMDEIILGLDDWSGH